MRGYEAQCSRENCPETVFLPESNPLQPFEVQPYPPTGTWPLLFVCPLCKHPNTYTRDYFHPTDRPDRRLEDAVYEGLWFLTVQCPENNCGLLLRLHTTASSDSDAVDVARTIYPAIQGFRCEANHNLNPENRIAVIQQPVLVG
jgi:hypothetical protein